MLSHDQARLDDPKVPEDRELIALIGYGSYDSESHKPRDAEIFDEYFETLSPEGASEYEESETTDARVELRMDEEGYW